MKRLFEKLKGKNEYADFMKFIEDGKQSKEDESKSIDSSSLLDECFRIGSDFFFKKKSFKVAEKYFKIAGEQGLEESSVILGYLYQEGYGVKKDYLKAKEYFEKSAEQGNSYALLNLGTLYKIIPHFRKKEEKDLSDYFYYSILLKMELDCTKIHF